MDDLSIVFQCDPVTFPSGDTLYSVYAIIEDYKIKLDETSSCEAVEPNQYEALQLPYDALAAIGGKTSKATDTYYYVERKGEQLLFFRREVGNSQAIDSTYQLIAIYKDGSFTFLEAPS